MIACTGMDVDVDTAIVHNLDQNCNDDDDDKLTVPAIVKSIMCKSRMKLLTRAIQYAQTKI